VATTGAIPPSVTKIRLRISIARVCPPASGLRSMGQLRYRPEGSSREDTRQTLSVARGGPTGPVETAGAGHLSMSPTTKNIEPRIATMSATRQPSSTSGSTAMLLNDALRSFIRHGVFSPRETR
jgi:hypothetical protein